MNAIALLILGATLGCAGWWLVAHWGAWVWWTWLTIGFAGGVVVGAPIAYLVIVTIVNDGIARAFGW